MRRGPCAHPLLSTLLRALQFFRPERGRIAGVLTLMLAGIGANLLKPWPMAVLVDSVLGSQPLPNSLRAWSDDKGNSSPCWQVRLSCCTCCKAVWERRTTTCPSASA